MLSIYGAVILNGEEFDNNQIHNLLHRNVTGWTFGGDQLEEESDFCVASEDGAIEEGFKTLEETLAFVNRLNEIPVEAQAQFVANQKRAG